MTVISILVGIFGFVIILFVVTHLGPLDQEQVARLAGKRRNRKIRAYFSFVSEEYTVDKNFKNRMNPNGSFYPSGSTLKEFPAVAAALLKYKKHEWIIVAFEKEKTVEVIWLNKGFDRSSVSLYLPIENIAEISINDGYSSVLFFHNHPNSNPNQLNCSQPSEMDLRTAVDFAGVLNERGVNLVEFVCERGSHYEYFLSAADNFFPLHEIVSKVETHNGNSKMSNLSLHWERLF